MSVTSKLVVGTALLGLTMAGSAIPAAAAARTAAAPYPVCYGSEAYVKNQYGQKGGYAKTSWCLRGDGYFETQTGTSSVKDLVRGDGVAASVWLWGKHQGGENFKVEYKRDTTATPGATGWGFDGYLKHMSIWVCLGKSKPGTTNAYCAELTPAIRYPW
ncbi:hypothetical protein GO001_22435 [Streptomyces sp. NRRL B-1677]|uniref:hypothetical protein n=1 Tax=Streptomyces sp. NRRL B-1677 TaxID=2682966 RepID=UPI001892CD96|nr:hypothetical protein [Streptomyces sp. NRRL B-1677]MBF6047950.1 hypothetical protein [Streptomyces sp. NRRL B-1677]